MSIQSDEIISMNYSYTSQENGKKQSSKKTNKTKKELNTRNNDTPKKIQNLIKSPISSLKKQFNNITTLPELENRGSNLSKKKHHLTSSSFNKNNNNN